MAEIGLATRVSQAVVNIDTGRKGFAIEGKEREGRILYEDGILEAMSVFQEVSNQRFTLAADPHSIILVEAAFITQEFQLCDKTDTDTINSLTKAIESFDDAFFALKAVEDKTLYQGAELTHPHNRKYRVNSYPKDAFHIACISHKTRLLNILRSPGIDPMEKTLLKQRLANLITAQNSYAEKQKQVMKDLI